MAAEPKGLTSLGEEGQVEGAGKASLWRRQGPYLKLLRAGGSREAEEGPGVMGIAPALFSWIRLVQGAPAKGEIPNS